MEAGQCLDLSMDDVVEVIGSRQREVVWERGKLMPWAFLYKQFGTSNNNQDQVLSHLVMTVHRLFQSFTTQILMFMRYGLVVGDKEVVAVVLSDIEDPLTYPRAEIKGKLDGRLARTCQKYYFTARFRFPIYTVGGEMTGSESTSFIHTFYLLN